MPGNSGLPVHISAKIHPMLQTSSAVEYFLHVWVFIAFGLGPKCELSTRSGSGMGFDSRSVRGKMVIVIEALVHV